MNTSGTRSSMGVKAAAESLEGENSQNIGKGIGSDSQELTDNPDDLARKEVILRNRGRMEMLINSLVYDTRISPADLNEAARKMQDGYAAILKVTGSDTL